MAVGEGRDLHLTIAGSSRSFPELAAELRRRIAVLPNVAFLDHVDDATLQRLYTQCDFTVFPTDEEGFGLPILESVWNARPCICHNDGAIAEAASPGGCYMVDVRDPETLRHAIFRLARHREFYTRLATEAVNRPIRTWRVYAEEVVGILGHVAPGRELRAIPPSAPERRWASTGQFILGPYLRKAAQAATTLVRLTRDRP